MPSNLVLPSLPFFGRPGMGPSSFLALNGVILAFPRLLPGVFLRSVTLGCGDESIRSGPASGSSSVNSKGSDASPLPPTIGVLSAVALNPSSSVAALSAPEPPGVQALSARGGATGSPKGPPFSSSTSSSSNLHQFPARSELSSPVM